MIVNNQGVFGAFLLCEADKTSISTIPDDEMDGFNVRDAD